MILSSSEKFKWAGISASERLIPAVETLESARPAHHLVVHLSRPSELEWLERGRFRRRLMSPGDVCVGAAGTIDKRRLKEVNRVALIALDPKTIEQAVGGEIEIGKIEFINQEGGRDSFIENSWFNLLKELQTRNLRTRLYAESLGAELAAHLVRHYSNFGRPAKLQSF